MIYIVNCDLAPRGVRLVIGPNKPTHNDFYIELQSSEDWWHYIDKTWLISTDESLAELHERLSRHLVSEDKLLITRFQGDYAGLLTPEAWNWIDEHMKLGEVVKQPS